MVPGSDFALDFGVNIADPDIAFVGDCAITPDDNTIAWAKSGMVLYRMNGIA